MHGLRRKGVEGLVVGRMHRHELADDVVASSVISTPWLAATPA